jgi:hypothetical protein
LIPLYYIGHILPEIGALRDVRDRQKLVIHADNAKPHVPKRVRQHLDEGGLRNGPHPLDSPDLAPNAFFLFGHVKKFQTAEELLEAVVQILSHLPLAILMATFHQWMERLQACISGRGEYVKSISILC